MNETTVNYQRTTLLLIISATILRICVAAFTELGNDEVYYRLYADPLQWNYFDHPPMVGWLIRLSTVNLWLDQGVFIRLGAILCAALSTWFIFRCGQITGGERAGFYAAVLYTAGIYSSIIAGTFILPDSPQMLCWTAALLLMIRLSAEQAAPVRTLLLFGTVAGGAMLCKIHSAFLWSGLGLFILLYRRHWLRHWSVYAAALITLLCCIPVIGWNLANDFITFRYHGERVDVTEGGLRLDYFGSFLGGEIFYTNPLVFVALVAGLIKGWKRFTHDWWRILLLTAFPLLILATLVSFFRELLPHWTGPAFVTLMVPAAVAFASQPAASPRLPGLFRSALILIVFAVFAGLLLIGFYPGTLGKKEPARLGYGDFTLDMVGWKKFAPVFDSIIRSTHPDNRLSGTVMVADEWFPAAHIDYYLARPAGVRMLVTGPVDKIHQYEWLNRQRGPLPRPADVYLVSPSNSPVHPENIPWLQNRAPLRTDTVVQYRSHVPVRNFIVQYYPQIMIPEIK